MAGAAVVLDVNVLVRVIAVGERRETRRYERVCVTVPLRDA